MKHVLLLAVVACKTAAPAPAPVGPAPQDPPLRPAGPATVVVTLEPGQPTPVLDGPFLVTTVNPGSSMAMAIASSHRCDDAALAWFGYSGGGVAVARAQTLCVRSDARASRTNGFSGYDPSAALSPVP